MIGQTICVAHVGAREPDQHCFTRAHTQLQMYVHPHGGGGVLGRDERFRKRSSRPKTPLCCALAACLR